MDVYSTELEIRLSFGKTSEFREDPPFGTPLACLEGYVPYAQLF
jgi:hypothetical protein